MFAKTTLDEVARQVGVSASTVSRVLNGAKGVNEGTRERVLAAVRKINYRPNAARASGQSRLIGFLMPAEAEQWGVRTNFTEQALRAITDVAGQFNYAAMVGAYSLNDGTGKAEDQMIAHREFAGALLFRTRDEIRDSRPFREAGIPCVVVNRLLPETSLNYIGPDHQNVAFTAAAHLIECGYRRIGFLAGKKAYASHRLYKEGFERAHAEARVNVDPKLITEIELNVEGGYAGACRLLEHSPRPEALIVTGDRASLGCMKALSDLKLKIPRDIGVLAMDGTPETAFANPPLTAVEIPWYEMLAMGTRLLIDLIEHRSPIEQIGVRFSTRLVVRKSTQSKQVRSERKSVHRRIQR